MLPFFTDDQIHPHLDYDSVITALDAAYADLGRGQAAILPRQRCAADADKFSSMGGLWATQHVAATKSYPTVDGKFSFLINLFDTQRNLPLAVMAANEITRFRTSAQTAMVAARVLPAAVRKVALFGAGVQGLAQVEALSRRVAFDELAIVDPAVQAAPQLDLACQAAVTCVGAEQAVRGADVVITATRSKQPVFDGAWLQAGAFVAAIGVSAAGGRELDSLTLSRAERVIVEWMPQSMQEAGDVLAWLLDCPDQRHKIVDLPTLSTGQWPKVGGIQVFKSVGTGLADTACAWLAWQRLGAHGSAVAQQGA